jgi:hypothetical protein
MRREGGVLWVAFALVGLFGAAACESPPAEPVARTAEVGLPDDAPPVAVLESFLKSLAIRDCEHARAYSTNDGFRQVGGLCDRIVVVHFDVVGERARSSRDEVVFDAILTIDGRSEGLSGGSRFFFALERQPSGAWRIAGGGSDP